MSAPDEFGQTASRASLIGLMAFGGAILGFSLQLLVAYYFGAGTNTDAFFMAQSTSELLSKLLLGGSITAVFLPLFVERITRGARHDAWRLALNIFHLNAAVFVIAITSLALFAEPFVNFIAPGFDGETKIITIKLLRVLLPSFLFLFLVELSTSMLHALKQFALPASLRLVSPLISMLAIITLVKSIGIYALAIGVITGSVIQFAVLLWGLHRQGLTYRFIFQPLDPAIKKLLYLVYPFILSVLVTQGAGLVYRILVSDLTAGSLAALKFAEKITQLLAIIFLNSVTLVIFPLLSEKASRQDFAGMRETIASAIRLVTFITVPIILGVALLREPLIAFVYQRGSFSGEDAAMTSIALLYLVIGLTTNGISSILGHATLALQQTRAAVAITIASQAIAIALFILLTPSLAHAGLALASSLIPLSIALLHFLYLSRHIPNLISIFKHATFAKTIILSILLGLVIFSLKAISYELKAFYQVLIPTLVGAVVYCAGAYLWRVPEMQQLLAILRGKMQKLNP